MRQSRRGLLIFAAAVGAVVVLALGASLIGNQASQDSSSALGDAAIPASSPSPSAKPSTRVLTCDEWQKEVNTVPSSMLDATEKQAAAAGCDVLSPAEVGGNTENLRTCYEIQADYLKATKNGTKARAEKLRKEGDKSLCTLVPYKGSIASGSTLPKVDGVAWKWADNPDCDYFGCFGMTVRADDQPCPNGLYVEINLLDGKGNVIGYSNDTVGSLSLGQKAKLIFDVTDNDVKSAELTDISCY